MSRNRLRRAALMLGCGAVLATTLGTTAIAARPKAKALRAASVSALPRGATISGPSSDIVLSNGRGRIITLPSEPAFVWSSKPGVASILVSGDQPRQIQLMAMGVGESTLFARNRAGVIIWSANVRVGENINSLDQMLHLAMPDAKIVTTSMDGGMVLLTGTVGAPSDAEEAERLTKAYLGANATVLSRLRTATPMTVHLQVRIAEVSRSISKAIGVNLANAGGSFGFAQGRAGGITVNPGGGGSFTAQTNGATIAALGRLFGGPVGGSLDLSENNGLVNILAEPTLTAMSGETASFLAGGECPIPIASSLGNVSVEFKQYGVSLSFTPTVLSDGRISMRVRPEVSQLSGQGSVTLNGLTIPAITTRRTETTVELGSGQSFMIGGLLQNTNNNSIAKTPFLGDIPVLGALFRSTNFQRNQTELMIVVTPYLVKPVDANRIAYPTDGVYNANDAQTFLLGDQLKGKSGAVRPMPTLAPSVTVPAPSVGAALVPVPASTPATRSGPAPAATARTGKTARTASIAPGFSN